MILNAVTLITRFARYYADRTAVVFGELRRTFGEVNERANRLANGLLSLGVKKGDRVAFLCGNCPEYIEIVFAKHKIGAVDIPLNTRLSPQELAWQIKDCQTTILFVAEDYLDRVVSLRSEVEGLDHIISFPTASEDTIPYEELISGSSAEEPRVETEGGELGRIVYTAGTTGRPKGIMLPRRTELSVTRNLLLDMIPYMNSRDVFLGLQPLYHAVGAFVLPCWVRGTTHVIVPDFSPETAFEAIEREEVTVIKTVPTVLIRLISHPDIGKHDLSSVRTIIYGASPMPVAKLKEAIRLFPRAGFIQSYGQSEAYMTICRLREEEHVVEGAPEEVARLASVGRPYTLVEVRVVDKEGRDVVPGEVGEVIVKGDHNMIGYWKNPEATAEALRDGWVYTRDMAKVDEAGYIFLVDRKSEMIVSGGLNIYPAEVERVLYQHPAVMEAAAFGVPDKEWGEAVKAVVALKPGARAGEEEIIDFCKERLASYKKPKSVDIIESLPKSPEGKILRRELREPYWRGQERRIH